MKTKQENYDKETLAYTAGIIDGEGTFWRGSAKNGQGRSYTESRIIVSNTNLDLLNWLKEKFGGNISKASGGNTLGFKQTKQCYRFSLAGHKAENLAKQIQPYLIVKSEQVKKVLQPFTK